MADNRESRSAIFARKVRALRQERGWSQAQMGQQLARYGQKLGQSRVATIEDTGSVTLDQADAFADAFGVPVEVLLYEQPPAASDIYIRQLQRLSRICNAVWDHREEINRIAAEIHAELPGKLPPGAVVTASSVYLPGAGE
jgi:transcriptional regulator with XRE-family HTH domain